MSSKAAEVIELLDSDDDEIVVIHSEFIQPILPTTRRDRRCQVPEVASNAKPIEEPARKRLKVVSSRDTCTHDGPPTSLTDIVVTTPRERCHQPVHAGVNRVINIDREDNDDALVHPGVIPSASDWIHSRTNTIAIVQHIRQNDKWSCGYRNLQMLLSSLLPHLPPNHVYYQKVPHRQDQITIPSLKQIQRTLERAWMEGYDPRGAAHYKHKLYGKHSWIGAVEVSSLLSYWGIDSAVVQFIRCKESREALPRFIRAYFNKWGQGTYCPFCSQRQLGALVFANRILDMPTTTSLDAKSSNSQGDSEKSCPCPSLPLYLQWEGHSVTVVGMDGTEEILIFDPLKNKRPTKLLASKLVKKDTQVVLVTNFQSLSACEQRARQHIGAETRFVATAALHAVVQANNNSK